MITYFIECIWLLRSGTKGLSIPFGLPHLDWLFSNFFFFCPLLVLLIPFFGYDLHIDFNMDMKYRKLLLGVFFILMSLVYHKHYKKKIDAIIAKYKKRRIIVKDWMLIIIAVMLAFSFVFWDWLYKLLV